MIFLSYRRQDSGPLTRRLAEHLARSIDDEIFVDTDQIRSGDKWANQINAALRKSTLVLVVIGPQWLRLQDDFGRRRLDQLGDWVHQEIEYALENQIPIIPVLISGAALPPKGALPESIQKLKDSQEYKLDDEYWKRDVDDLVNRVCSLGFKRLEQHPEAADVVFPPKVDTSQPLSEAEMKDALAKLPGWSKVTRPGAGPGEPARVELYRVFRFRSYADAMHFMITASRYIHATDHHPDWQNLWVTVRIWLTTWDIGHKPSFKDTRLAEYLETLYQSYKV